MIKKLGFVIKFSIFFLFTALMIHHGIKQPKVFILHSYNTDYTWVKEVNQGIMKKLKDNPSYNVRWYYMDSKNNPDLSFRQRAGIWARYQIADFKPDYLVAIDDDAQAFVTKFYVDTPGINIIFSGVNGEGKDYGFESARNVTGIYERLPLYATKEFIKTLGSIIKLKDIKVIHVGDTSNTVKADEKNIFNFNWDPIYFIDSILVETFDQWKEAILKSQHRAHFFYITNYRKLRVNKYSLAYVPPQEVMRWTVANSKIPIIGGNSFVAEDGAEMAIATSPIEQGRVAIEMLQKLIQGKSIKDVPIQETQEFLVVLRKDNPIKLPSIYQSYALSMDRYIN